MLELYFKKIVHKQENAYILVIKVSEEVIPPYLCVNEEWLPIP